MGGDRSSIDANSFENLLLSGLLEPTDRPYATLLAQCGHEDLRLHGSIGPQVTKVSIVDPRELRAQYIERHPSEWGHTQQDATTLQPFPYSAPNHSQSQRRTAAAPPPEAFSTGAYLQPMPPPSGTRSHSSTQNPVSNRNRVLAASSSPQSHSQDRKESKREHFGPTAEENIKSPKVFESSSITTGNYHISFNYNSKVESEVKRGLSGIIPISKGKCVDSEETGDRDRDRGMLSVKKRAAPTAATAPSGPLSVAPHNGTGGECSRDTKSPVSELFVYNHALPIHPTFHVTGSPVRVSSSREQVTGALVLV